MKLLCNIPSFFFIILRSNDNLQFIYNPLNNGVKHILFRCEVQPSEKETHWLCETNQIETSPLWRNINDISMYVKCLCSLHVPGKLQQFITINYLLGIVFGGCPFDNYFVILFSNQQFYSNLYLAYQNKEYVYHSFPSQMVKKSNSKCVIV